jgi:hypothetical protein
MQLFGGFALVPVGPGQRIQKNVALFGRLLCSGGIANTHGTGQIGDADQSIGGSEIRSIKLISSRTFPGHP